MKFLFIFLDGIGLGANDPQINPLVRADMPFLQGLLGGRRLLLESAPYEGEQATLLALDACLGVPGLPQSATGQAALLTGRNIPAAVGEHYGPKPNPPVARLVEQDNLFQRVLAGGKSAALLNGYPPRYFAGVDSGKRLYSSIPLAVTSAGLPLFNDQDVLAGRALSADFTGQGWRDFLGYADAPVFAPRDAGLRLAGLAGQYDFSFFEYWASDYAGHKQDMPNAVQQMEVFDGVLAGLAEVMPADMLVLVTSDHGNMEDLSVRRHTDAPVPGLLLGNAAARQAFASGLADLTHVAPAILRTLGLSLDKTGKNG